jgi:hypothetical protein
MKRDFNKRPVAAASVGEISNLKRPKAIGTKISGRSWCVDRVRIPKRFWQKE